MFAFKKYLREHIEKLVKNVPKVKTDNPGDCNIVDIQFVFKNVRLMHLAFKRGKAIEEDDEEERLDIEAEIIKSYDGMH